MTRSGEQGRHQYERVTVVGCGLIGASFALALRRACAHTRIAGWDASPQVLDEALRRGVIDEVDASLVRGEAPAADLVYLATPITQIISFLRDYGAAIQPRTVITDAGSTKLEICRAARAHLPQNCEFIGGHPIAGSHLGGPSNAHANLFENAAYVLTPERESVAVENLAGVVSAFGACVRRMDAAEHDRAMALVSHLPQIISSALAAIVAGHEDAQAMHRLSGAGYRDMTRLAASSWSIWRDILATNREPIAEALDAYIARLTAIRDELRRGDDDDDNDAARSLFASVQQT